MRAKNGNRHIADNGNGITPYRHTHKAATANGAAFCIMKHITEILLVGMFLAPILYALGMVLSNLF